MKQILEWRIKDYFKRCAEFLRRNETGVFVSPLDKNMAKIDLSVVTFNNVRYPTICISIKTVLCLKLISVHCYRDDCLSIIEQKFDGLSTEWKTLVVQNQFPRMTQMNEEGLALKFEFFFKNNEKELECSLQTDMGGLLMNPAFSDITIKTSEGDELPAHKILLVARSDVFRAQFQHDTAEKSTSTVECAFETNVVKDMLSYIYQDVAPNIEETAFKLVVAADYYQLDRLKELCGPVLGKKLNVDNAVQFLILADAHNICSLKNSVLEYITNKPNGDKIVKKEDWTLLSSELLRNIFEYSVSNTTHTTQTHARNMFGFGN